MKANLVWKDAMAFDGTVGLHTVVMDAKTPLGKDTGATPKELIALGLGGCTAMDVIALLKKYKQLPKSFEVKVEIETSTGKQPAVFEQAVINYLITGEVDPEKLKEAVHLSQTKYCGVSAMLSKAFPILYRITLNGIEVGSGKSEFESQQSLNS